MKNSGDEDLSATDRSKQQPYIKLFPNPSNSSVAIEYDLIVTGNTMFKLFDLLGNLVWEIQLTNAKGEVVLDISSYPIGTYFYQVTATSEVVLPTGRLLIMR